MPRLVIGTMLLVAGALLLGAEGPVHAQTFDHLKCYRIRDPVVANYGVQMTDQFGAESCKRNQGRYLCTAAEKTAVVPSPPGGGPSGTSAGNFLCYETHCRNFPPDTLADDQFGMRMVHFGRTQLMCSPVTLNPSTPTTLPGATTSTTTSPTASTTTTSTMPPATSCGSAIQPECDGSCPPNQICTTTGTGCACFDFTCGAAEAVNFLGSTPECSGLCPPATPYCVQGRPRCSGGDRGGQFCTTDADCPGAVCGELCGECVAGPARACGDAEEPECDGVCPPGQVCGVGHASGDLLCECVDLNCGGNEAGSAGPPLCYGLCPPDAPICRNIGGTCLCLPN